MSGNTLARPPDDGRVESIESGPAPVQTRWSEGERQEISRRMEELLAPSRSLFARVAATVAEVFRSMAVEKSPDLKFARRPLICLRLPVEGNPPAHLAVRPGWT